METEHTDYSAGSYLDGPHLQSQDAYRQNHSLTHSIFNSLTSYAINAKTLFPRSVRESEFLWIFL